LQQLQITPNPLLGFFFRENLCIGLSFPFEYNVSNYRNNLPIVLLIGNPNNISNLSKQKNVVWNLSPFVRGYIGKKSLQLFMQADVILGRNVNYSYYTYRLTGPTQLISKTTRLGIGVGVGINYSINQKFGAEALLSYKRQYEAISADRWINPGSDIGVRVGLVAFLSKP
jgi:hypothetical protein